jgi:hypothetical protein
LRPITALVALPDVLARISQLESLTALSYAPQTQRVPAQQTGAASSGGFARALMAATAAMPSEAPAGGTGSAILTAAESQIGQAEDPPGSNDGPAISAYRSAVAGAQAGAPWCAYFASWAAAQAGTPLGDAGQGLGSVSEITDWAAANGRLLPADATPQPGDLILFGTRHVGIVESVNPDGTITTVEGNSRSAVSRVTREPGEATGFVQLA